MYVEHMVDLFREVRRVLRKDGTLWLNMGDSYTDSGRGGNPGSSLHTRQRSNRGSLSARDERRHMDGLAGKQLLMMPARLALALQQDGWWLRADIVWAKGSPMPESVRDRPTKSHEYVFLLAKSARYFYDNDAIREPLVSSRREGGKTPDGWDTSSGKGSHGSYHRDGREKGGVSKPGYKDRAAGRADGISRSPFVMRNREYHPGGRNARSVWTINAQPFKGAHFAVFPWELARRCIDAGASMGGCCSECGAPRRRVLDEAEAVEGRGSGNSERKLAGDAENGRVNMHMGSSVPWAPTTRQTLRWAATCAHDAPTAPCRVLDPFAGSGTTLAVAVAVAGGREAIGVELNPAYAELARQRVGPVLCEVIA
jgi:DNA modification methylase